MNKTGNVCDKPTEKSISITQLFFKMKSPVASIVLITLASIQLNAESVSGTWFTYDAGQAVKDRYVVTEDSVEMGNYSYWNGGEFGWENVAEYPVHYNLDAVVIYEQKGYYYALKFMPVEAETHSHVILRAGSGEDLEDVKHQAIGEEDESSVLFSMPAFTEEESEKLEAMKGFSEITREDLIESLNRRGKYKKVLEDFFTENPQAVRMAWRFGQNLMHKEMLDLGYNPYEAYEGNPLARFEDDEEVMKLLTELQ